MANNTEVSATNNGFTIVYSGNLGYTKFNDQTYTLIQFHFHQPSENYINGVEYESEVHFVHKNFENNSLLVLGILFDENTDQATYQSSVGWRWLESIFYGSNLLTNSTMPLSQQEVNTQNVLTYELLNTAFANNMFYFDGSLTTPNCNEGVKWLVSKQVMYMSHYQKRNFARMFPKIYTATNSAGVTQQIGNNRPTQDIASRTIYNICLTSTFKFVETNYTSKGHDDDDSLVYLWVFIGLLCFVFLAVILCYIFKQEGAKNNDLGKTEHTYNTVGP